MASEQSQARKSTIRVYGWQGFRREAGQVRLIVAATSKAAAARAAGYKYPSQMFNLTETGNSQELEAALAEPGVVFWRDLDDYRGQFEREAE